MDLVAFFAGLALGVVHVLGGPDHLAAIAPLAGSSQRSPWLGVRWGLGHSAGVLLVAFAAWFARDLLPLDALSGWSERLVGLALIALGLFGFYRLMARGVAAHEHGARRHEHTAFAFGTLHGLAGSSHLLGVLPALAQPTRADALIYLAGFALGTIGAMSAFASAIGWLGSRTRASGPTAHARLCGVTSSAAILVGAWWLATGG